MNLKRRGTRIFEGDAKEPAAQFYSEIMAKAWLAAVEAVDSVGGDPATVGELLVVLRNLWELIESGYLVRNTEADHLPGWEMKQTKPVSTLQTVATLLAKLPEATK